VNGITEDFLEEMAPYLTPDLAEYLEVFGEMFDELDAYAGLRSEEASWQVLLSAKNCPAGALPYLAQYRGETLPAGLAVEMQREWVTDAPNQIRGTSLGIALAAQRSLVGSRMVAVQERTGGTPAEDHLTVVTYTADTPSPDRTLTDIRSNTPADIVLHYVVSTGQLWTNVKTNWATWAALKAGYADWAAVRTAAVGGTVYSRPRPLPSG
jgi:hypothetical protein